MSLISKLEQAQNEVNITSEIENVEVQGGLVVRTDLRAGVGEEIVDAVQGSWDAVLGQLSSLQDTITSAIG